MKTRKAPPTEPQPIGISFIRFSTPDQRKGDSLRRQTEGTQKWCDANGVVLDTSLSIHDLGRSAFSGKHRSDKAAFGGFLHLIREGKVPRGSYLIVENLDRLSREDERTALRLWLDILDAGVNIVQMHPETVFRHERSDMVDIMRAIIELSRGHSESRMKSVRTLANWDAARKKAREEKRVMTRRLPAWVEEKEGALRLVAPRARVVKKIFRLAATGLGITSIVKRLTAEGDAPFGGRERDEEAGGTRKKRGLPYGCGEWRTSYVRSILSDRRALGEYQPRDKDEKAVGDPIAGYYPRVVSDGEFYAARAAMGARRNPPGRIGKNVANLFGGLMRSARDGTTYYAKTRSDEYGIHRVLLNKSSVENGTRAYTFPYEVFEAAILKCLREIDPSDVVPDVPPAEVSVIQNEMNWLRERKTALALELRKGDIAAIAEALRELEAREAELQASLDTAGRMEARPVVDTWKDVKGLAELLGEADDQEDVRLRLRSAIRRVIEDVWILVVPRGRDRLCAVQVHFRDRSAVRSYLILNRPSHANAASRREGRWWCRSFADAGQVGDLDLRKSSDARTLERALTALPLDFDRESD